MDTSGSIRAASRMGMDASEREREIRAIQRILLEVQLAAQRQAGELEQLKLLLASLQESSEQFGPVERDREGLVREGKRASEGPNTDVGGDGG